MSLDHPQKILIIRRDNIGDLVCTTPLIAALRRRFPDGWLGALVNSYNAPVLDGNPDLDRVFAYTKAKHRGRDEWLPAILWRRLEMMRELRRLRLDDVILAAPVGQVRLIPLARWLKPKRIIGFGTAPELDVALAPDSNGRHEVDDVFRIASIYGVEGPPPACKVVAPPVPPATQRVAGLTVGIHISARKPSQRWAAERFAETMRLLAARGVARFVLLWSPGADDNPLHPGDDRKAREVLALAGCGSAAAEGASSLSIAARPTQTLAELIAALAECDALICADGGAMHLAAGLGLPIVCLFGNSAAQRWRPWGVPCRLLQKPSLDVAEIGVDEVVDAFTSLKLRPTASS